MKFSARLEARRGIVSPDSDVALQESAAWAVWEECGRRRMAGAGFSILHADAATISACLSGMDATNLVVDADHVSSLVTRREQALIAMLLPECRDLSPTRAGNYFGISVTSPMRR